jgi:O-antigen/teichoic acid export membrane protein
LGVEDFGIYNVVGGVVAMFGFLRTTLASGTQRFLTFELGKNDFIKLKKTFSAALNIHIILAVIVFILAETAGLWFLNYKMNIPADREYAALWTYQFSILASMLSIIQVPYNAGIIAHERMNVYAYVSIIEVTLKLGIVYLLLISDHDKLITYAILIFAVNLIIMTVYRQYCKKQYSECRFGLVSDKNLYKSMLVFSGWNIFGCGAVMGATQGVNILLNMFFGPVVNAARGISVQVSNAINTFVTNFQTAVNPQIVKYYAAGKIDELHNLLFQNAKFSFCLMWLMVLPVFLKTEAILGIWLGTVPEYTALFCRLMLLQSLISCMQRPFIMAIHATGKMKLINLTAGIVLLSVLPISYFLLRMGVPAYIPFIVYVGSSLIEFFWELFFLRKWIALPALQLFKKVFAPLSFIIVCSLPIPVFFTFFLKDNLISLLLVSIISVLSVSVLVYYIALNKGTRAKIITKVKAKVLRK